MTYFSSYLWTLLIVHKCPDAKATHNFHAWPFLPFSTSFIIEFLAWIKPNWCITWEPRNFHVTQTRICIVTMHILGKKSFTTHRSLDKPRFLAQLKQLHLFPDSFNCFINSTTYKCFISNWGQVTKQLCKLLERRRSLAVDSKPKWSLWNRPFAKISVMWMKHLSSKS